MFERIQQFNIHSFLIMNEILNYSIVPYIFAIVSFLFEAKVFCLIYLTFTIWKNLYKFDQNTKKNFTANINIIKFAQCYFFLILVFYSIKKFTKIARPFCSLNNFYSISNNLDFSDCYNSFPSAHMGIAFLFCLQCWRYAQNIQTKFFLIIMLIIVACSRISLAMHFPLDLISSIPIVILLKYISDIVFDKYIVRIIQNY